MKKISLIFLLCVTLLNAFQNTKINESLIKYSNFSYGNNNKKELFVFIDVNCPACQHLIYNIINNKNNFKYNFYLVNIFPPSKETTRKMQLILNEKKNKRFFKLIKIFETKINNKTLKTSVNNINKNKLKIINNIISNNNLLFKLKNYNFVPLILDEHMEKISPFQ